MQQVIYADVLFFVDLSMDFLALYIVAAMLKIHTAKYSLAFAAAVGSLYSVISVILRHDSVIFAAVVAIIMNLIAFGLCRVSRLAIRSVVFLVVNFILGGAMTAVFNVFNSFSRDRFVMIYGEITQVQKKIPFSVFIIGFCITAVISVIFIRLFLPKASTAHKIAEITYGNKTVKYDLLCDSGNLLTEPLSGDPVIFLSQSAMKRLVGDTVFYYVISSEPEFLQNNLRTARIILYETVNGRQSGVCIRADKVKVDGKSCRAWICVSPNNKDDGDGILPASLLT